MKPLNQYIHDVEVPGTRQFANKVNKYNNSIDLTLGQSGFEPAEYIKDAMIKAIQENKLRYTHNKGLLELRKAISEYIFNRYQTLYNPEREILVTNGGSEGIDSVLRTILNAGDEVILPSPTYLGYEPIIKLLGCHVKLIDTTDTNFKVTEKKIRQAITERTKAIIFNYPSNPTGVTLKYEDMASIVDVLKDTGIYIISDEIYSENVYEHKHRSFTEFQSIRSQLFVINGLSKSHAITGARVGYILSTSHLIEEVTTVHLYNSICVATPSQYGAISALKNGDEDIKKMNQSYLKRRDYIYDRIKKMNLSVTKPEGTFYIFPNISQYNKDSFKFCTQLLESEQLAVVPGKSFSEFGEGHIRMSFACTMEEIENACDRLERFLENYGNK
ncbi:aminotransferase class I/II-fold pyridoxal phosphate-dependent enzyme [Staphylococcus agnetis]|uniref:Aminotransferase n=1 Tax=Staphylococcus agnetis TaxID=985762 RepID=A0ABX3Z225_9STAP|nr:aminotransferase class I/II-fold pyridoxal phosphate-dependent enzyme [Staphylococcus agnetis]OSP17784.1 N-acetyl-L,L-diaminopimelate aminotransferase [Staphylococcus agnetis]OSP22208.1 N-acetyl-L,L-diaminopimelate aminotransferase [Staphylococcus agnetis]OTW30021.1 N-acetyl-L,L-diaminopimelate aminotransferase [Staphylococcus agnetis]